MPCGVSSARSGSSVFRRRAALDPADVVNAIYMGPNAMRLPKQPAVPAGTRTVTFDVEILFARLPRLGESPPNA
jgi:hypothetical protein